MEHRNLGRSGLRVSLLGLGCNNFGTRMDLDATRRVVHAALDLGVTFFDTADAYGRGASEALIGQVLGDRRKDAVLATKFGMAMDDADKLKGASRKYILAAVEASLKRLNTDWIDLYQLHQPDPNTPIEETLRTLDDLVSQGKVRYIGCSNLRAWQVVDAQWTSEKHGLERFASCQDELSVLNRYAAQELFPAMQAHGLSLLPYRPLAGGFLSGKYKRSAPVPSGTRLSTVKKLADEFLTDRNFARLEKLEAFGMARGKSVLDVAFGWLASLPTVGSVIAGASTPEQLQDNLKAVECRFSPEEMQEIDRICATAASAENK